MTTIPNGTPQRRSDDQGWTAGLPIWAKVVSLVGIPGAVSMYLVWMGANQLPVIDQKATQVVVETFRNRELIQQHIEQSEAMYRMLQRICSNTARNEDERQKCFDE